jgi:hypothetical protein
MDGVIATCAGGLGVLAAVVTGVGLPGLLPLFVVLPNATALALSGVSALAVPGALAGPREARRRSPASDEPDAPDAPAAS